MRKRAVPRHRFQNSAFCFCPSSPSRRTGTGTGRKCVAFRRPRQKCMHPFARTNGVLSSRTFPSSVARVVLAPSILRGVCARDIAIAEGSRAAPGHRSSCSGSNSRRRFPRETVFSSSALPRPGSRHRLALAGPPRPRRHAPVVKAGCDDGGNGRHVERHEPRKVSAALPSCQCVQVPCFAP